ncbi:hypothetical protein B0H14DRAFT_3173212 [Mycena olivaceomarginata]|nr:hypothetical protein B0H14DRAFT_3173212 [Mycena olivaceomarginata]
MPRQAVTAEANCRVDLTRDVFNVDIVLGALLVGTWANSVLYTVEVIQLLVSSAIAIDAVSMIANYASVYLVVHNHSLGLIRSSSLRLAQWPHWPKVPWLLGYWLLTRNKFITLTLFFLITVATGGAFACGVTIAIFPEYTNRRKVIIPGTTWLITEAVTDISIASALLWEFRKAKSSFKETRSLLKRLVAQTIQSGTAGASMALAVLVAFLANKESNGGFLGLPLSIPGSHIPVPTGIAYGLGRVYCITMLANLNSRKTGKTWSGWRMSSGANLETRRERGNQERSEGRDEYGDIHVHRTAVVHIDTPQELSTDTFKTNGLPDDSSAIEIEITVNNSASYSSKKKQDLFAA